MGYGCGHSVAFFLHRRRLATRQWYVVSKLGVDVIRACPMRL